MALLLGFRGFELSKIEYKRGVEKVKTLEL